LARAEAAVLSGLIEPVCADMGALGWPEGELDLLWSEGAAYNLGFAIALEKWRPLLAKGGLAVISEMSWFGDQRPEAAARFWAQAYPAMASELENRQVAREAGYEVIEVRPLPEAAWWQNYYGPLAARIAALKPDATGVLLDVIAETEQEMALFRVHADCYGYLFFLLRAV
jgi:serine/threonine-protein kinase HipA